MDRGLASLSNGVSIVVKKSQRGRAFALFVLVAVGRLAFEVAPAAAEPHRTSAQQRAALVRALKHDPRLVTKRWFVRKASLLGADVPVSFRLGSASDQSGTAAADDTIQLAFTPVATTTPLPDGTTVPTAISTLTGVINGSFRFSQDTSGYGLGVVELGFSSMQVLGTGFAMVQASDTTGCGPDTSLVNARGPLRIGQSTVTPSAGYIDLFRGSFSIDLRTSFSFASDIRSDCVLDGMGNPPLFTATSPTPLIGNPALPLRLEGGFRISPGLTADGRLRLGKLAISGAQRDSFVQLHTCTQAPPPANTCAASTDAAVTGRLSATAFTADVLVGASRP